MRNRPAVVTLLAAAVALCFSGGCAEKPADAPQRPLPSYSGHATELFDDVIEPAAVGLEIDHGYSARADPKLRERAQLSDAVLRVRVSTVTAKKEETGSNYEIGLQTEEKIIGEHPPSVAFTVGVARGGPSAGIIKNFEDRLVGKEFVAFVHAFVRPDGDTELHFHFSPDNKDVRAAVSDAIALGELK